VLLVAVLFVMVNLLVDLLYGWLDRASAMSEPSGASA